MSMYDNFPFIFTRIYDIFYGYDKHNYSIIREYMYGTIEKNDQSNVGPTGENDFLEIYIKLLLGEMGIKIFRVQNWYTNECVKIF